MVLYGYFPTHIIDFIGQVHLFMFVVSVVFHNDIDAFGITFLVCLPVVFLAFHGHCYLVLFDYSKIATWVLFVQKNWKCATLGYYVMFKFSNHALWLYSYFTSQLKVKTLKIISWFHNLCSFDPEFELMRQVLSNSCLSVSLLIISYFPKWKSGKLKICKY